LYYAGIVSNALGSADPLLLNKNDSLLFNSKDKKFYMIKVNTRVRYYSTGIRGHNTGLEVEV